MPSVEPARVFRGRQGVIRPLSAISSTVATGRSLGSRRSHRIPYGYVPGYVDQPPDPLWIGQGQVAVPDSDVSVNLPDRSNVRVFTVRQVVSERVGPSSGGVLIRQGLDPQHPFGVQPMRRVAHDDLPSAVWEE